MKLSKIFLITCVGLGILGWTPIGSDIVYGMLRPLSAVFFILFFASSVVEAAVKDHEEQVPAEAAKTTAAVNETQAPTRTAAAH